MGKFKNPKVLENPDASGTNFGYSVSVWNNFIAVSNTVADNDQGMVSIFYKTGNNFNLLKNVISPNGKGAGRFGESVILKDGYLFVGAMAEDVGDTTGAGAVHIFKLNGMEIKFFQTVSAPTPKNGSQFGYSLDVDNNYLVVGANLDDQISNNAGEVYIYRFERNEFRHLHSLAPSGLTSGENFGTSVSIRDGYLAVGAPASDTGETDAGVVFIYRFERNEFRHLKTISSPDAETNGKFGNSVSVEGGYLGIGATGQSGGSTNSGEVYVYKFDRNEFKHLQKIEPPDPETNSLFGNSLRLRDGYLFTGASNQDVDSSDTGEVYIYRFVRGEFKYCQTIPSTSTTANVNFGFSLDIHDGVLVISSPDGDNSAAEGNTRVYSYGI